MVIIGSDIQGCELAEFFASRGRIVTIVDKAERPGARMVDVLMAHLFRWFVKNSVTMINGVREYAGITSEGLRIIDKDGKEQLIPADTVIPALPLQPGTELFESLEGKVAEVYTVGDCNEPLLIADAISGGMTAAIEL